MPLSYTPEDLLKLASKFEADLTIYDETLTKEAKERMLDPKAKVRNRGTCVFPAGKGRNKSQKDRYPINTESQAKSALRYAVAQKSAPWFSGTVEEMRKAVQSAVYRKYPGLKKRHKEREKKSSELNELIELITKFAEEVSVIPSEQSLKHLHQLEKEDIDQLIGWGTAPEVVGNPPAWVRDPKVWARAKKAIKPYWKKYKTPYKIVADLYLGNFKGRIKKKKKS